MTRIIDILYAFLPCWVGYIYGVVGDVFFLEYNNLCAVKYIKIFCDNLDNAFGVVLFMLKFQNLMLYGNVYKS